MNPERRAAVKLLSLGLVALVIAILVGPESPIFVGASRSQVKETLGGEFPEVATYYPELGNLPVLGQGTINLPSRQIRWFNFSDASFNPGGAELLYRFLENFGTPAGGEDKILSYPIDEVPEQLFLTRTGWEETGSLFIVPAAAPLPDWIKPASDSIFSFTVSHADGRIISVVRVPTNVPPEAWGGSAATQLTTAIVTEACHWEVQVIPVSVDLTDSRRMARVWSYGQEVICNSLGLAVWRKQNGDPYGVYSSFAQASFLNDDGGNRVPVMIFPPAWYEAIPAGQVLTPP